MQVFVPVAAHAKHVRIPGSQIAAKGVKPPSLNTALHYERTLVDLATIIYLFCPRKNRVPRSAEGATCFITQPPMRGPPLS